LEVRVTWPDRTRLVPAAANCVVATLRNGSSVLGTKTLVRPPTGGTTTERIANLPAGSATLDTVAYPVADGSGTALARGSGTVAVTSGQTSTVNVSMSSTIHHLELGPVAPSAMTGQTCQLVVSARDAGGAIVLLWPAKLRWDTSSDTHAAVDADGLVTGRKPTGVNPGSVNVSVTDTESGKSASVPVTVLSSATVSVAPNPCTLSVGDAQTFAATVGNAPDTSVTWSVQEGAAGGAITQGGAYTAPATAGTFHVIARSVWDDSRSGSATVTVQDGGLIVIIR
jgi:hypothetical protein